MSFDDLFRRDRPNKTLQRTAAGMAVSCQKSAHRAGVSAFFTGIGLTTHSSRPAKAGGLTPTLGPVYRVASCRGASPSELVKRRFRRKPKCERCRLHVIGPSFG